MAAVIKIASVSAIDPKRLLYNEHGQEARFKSKPARELMSASDFTAYDQALKRLDCDAAGLLLNTSFLREYPQFQRAMLKTECGRHDDCRYWSEYSDGAFEELGFCRKAKSLEDLERELRQKYPVVPKFSLQPWPHKTVYQDQLLQHRDELLSIVIFRAELHSALALEMLADLVGRGDVFDATVEAQYYLSNRACHLANTCKEMAPRLEALRASMTADRVLFIEWKAKANVKRPNLHELLLGGKIAGTMPPQQAGGLSVRQLLFGEDYRGDRFKSKPARDLMSQAEYASYQEALKALEWERAGRILNTAFIRAYPEFERARLQPNFMEGPDCRFWLIFAGTEFPEFGFTWTAARFEEAESELRKQNSPIPKFAMKLLPSDNTPYTDVWLWRRDNALVTMTSIAGSGYVPALEKLAELVRRGDIFNASHEVELYLLLRMCYFGDACEAAASRRAALGSMMPPERVAVVEKAATKALGANLNSLLRGETSF